MSWKWFDYEAAFSLKEWKTKQRELLHERIQSSHPRVALPSVLDAGRTSVLIEFVIFISFHMFCKRWWGGWLWVASHETDFYSVWAADFVGSLHLMLFVQEKSDGGHNTPAPEAIREIKKLLELGRIVAEPGYKPGVAGRIESDPKHCLIEEGLLFW